MQGTLSEIIHQFSVTKSYNSRTKLRLRPNGVFAQKSAPLIKTKKEEKKVEVKPWSKNSPCRDLRQVLFLNLGTNCFRF